MISRIVPLLDLGHHDVRLPAGLYFMAQSRIGERRFGLPIPDGLDRLPAGRKVRDGGDGEIREVRQGQRSRDGRRRHDQVVRRDALLLQHMPLTHAELVLLVHHDHANAGQRDILAEDRLRADGDMDVAFGEPLAQRSAAGLLGVMGQQGHVHVRALEHLLDRQEMLLGQDLRRRQQQRLMLVGHRHQHGVKRDHGLARADVALQQTVHGFIALQVAKDVPDRLRLRLGELEWKACARMRSSSRRSAHGRRRRPALRMRLPMTRPSCIEHQLVIDKPLAGGCGFRGAASAGG